MSTPDRRALVAQAGIQISMDGRGRWMDNVFIERLWRSLKHEIEAGRAARSCGHVDNASALPTGPQPQHQEYVIAA